MKTFLLTITSAEKTVYHGKSSYCNIVSVSGNLGIEPGHESFLGLLRENSQVRFQDESEVEKTVTVENGIICFQENRCILVVSIPPGTGKEQ